MNPASAQGSAAKPGLRCIQHKSARRTVDNEVLPVEHVPVAMPLTWRDVERRVRPDAFTMKMLIEKRGRTRTRRDGQRR